MGMQDAQEVWTTLKRIHQRDDSAKVRSVLAEFMRFKLGPMDTIDGAASTFTHIQSEISSLKKSAEPSDDIKIEALLTALGPEYEPTIASLDNSTTLVYKDVVARLRKAESRLKRPSATTTMARLATTATPASTKKHTPKKGNCHHCDKPGHYLREYRKRLVCQGQGIIQVQFEGEDVLIDGVLYVPGLQGNLLSVGQLVERGIKCSFSQDGAYLHREGVVQAYATRIGRSYILTPTQNAHHPLATTDNNGSDDDHDDQNDLDDHEDDAQGHQQPDSYRLWHRRMGHVGKTTMKLLHKAVDGIPRLVIRRRKCQTRFM
jgi:gag-polypeptide of LTR copia-type